LLDNIISMVTYLIICYVLYPLTNKMPQLIVDVKANKCEEKRITP
jgi:hypothetical protein